MTDSRVRRGRKTQDIAAAYLRESGAVQAAAVPASARGRDIVNVPGVAPEVKARRGFAPKEWMKQAAHNAGPDIPVVIMRPDGMGPDSVEDWPVFFRFADAIKLLRRAGYW